MCIVYNFERELKLKGRSINTINQYKKQFKMFLDFFDGKDIRYISESDIKNYILTLHDIYGYSSIIHAIYSIEFYYLNVNSRKRIIKLPRPKKGTYIPTVLSISEIRSMINATDNIKHKCIIEVLFCHGLRRSELINLEIKDIDSENMILCVKNSKGAKDRNIPLNKECLKNLRFYFKKYKPKVYLFEGDSGLKYTASSLYQIIKKTANKANINKNVHPHTIRHSFASYLVQINTNLSKISEWLGHASTKTTDIYTHIVFEDNPIFI